MAINQFVARNGLISLDDSTISGSLFVSESVTATSFTGAFSGSVFGYVPNSATASLATTGSNTFSDSQIITGSLSITQNLTVLGSASFYSVTTVYETASVIYSSGSNQFGDAIDDTQTLIGNVIVSGSQQITGSLNAPNITGSLYGTASWAINSLTASSAESFIIRNGLTETGSVNITGSTNQIGNITLTGSLLVTQSYISTVNYIDFTILPTGSAPAHNQGRIHWLDDTKTLQIDTDVNNFMIEVGHQSVVRGRNITGVALTKGTVVYINGESGNRPTFTTASWTGDPTSAATLGFIAETITDSQSGYVITNGILRGINTNAYSPGTQLYLSSSGQFTSTVPISPLHEVRLGKTITQATDGYIYVDIMNGYEIGELHDVSSSLYSTGDLLVYNSGSRVWTNTKTLSGSYTLSGSLTTNNGISVQSLTASIISASFGITGSLFGTASWAVSASWVPAGGSNTQIQFNSGSAFTGDQYFTYNYVSHSLQQGYDAEATNQYAHAEGEGTTASGIASHAEGNTSVASGDHSHAEGDGTTASGNHAHAEGSSTNATGNDSHSEGIGTEAIGGGSHSEGIGSIAEGDYSHAEGSNTVAAGETSHAEGSFTFTGQYGYNATSVISGEITLDATYGDVKSAIDSLTGYIILDDRDFDNIHGIKLFSIVGIDSTTPTTIQLDSPINSTFAVIYVPGVAQPTNADVLLASPYAHVEGSGSIASGIASHAVGFATNTFRDYSYAGGEGTIAIQPGHHVVGKYNSLSGNTNRHTNAFTVGKGTSISSRDNILEVNPTQNQFYVSASNYTFKGLTTDNTIQNVVSIDTTSGELYITTGSAFGSGGSSGAGANVSASFTNQSNWTFAHSLGSRAVVIQTYDTSWNQIIPQSITLTNTLTATIIFPSNQSGFAVASVGGTTAITNAVSASYAATASYVNGNIHTSTNPALSASYALTSSTTTAFDGAWISYTPTWTAVSSDPVIGNGTLTGAYKIIGKTCFVRGRMTAGSSTTFGTGAWYFSLPVTASSPYGIIIPVTFLDNGINWYSGLMNGGRLGSTSKTEIQWQNTSGVAVGLTSTVPFTWGSADELEWNGSYETV